MQERKVLVVDDEENILELIKYNLSREGYEVEVAASGKQVLTQVEKINPDLIILDIMLPEINGYKLCNYLKEQNLTKKIPIIFLSAKDKIEDKVRGLDLGATDYLTKPFSPRELASRVKAVLRRLDIDSTTNSKEKISYGKLTIDLKGYRVLIAGEEISMTNKEFKLLSFLIDRLDSVCSRDEILTNVWGYDTFSGIRTVDVHIRMLRKKFAEYEVNQLEIQTVQRVGYKLTSLSET
ncbi:MAG: response regulator [Bacillota bacterium]